MTPAPGQIWFLEHPRLGNAQHGHFVLLCTDQIDGTYMANFIATERQTRSDFEIREDLDGFAQTGLRHSSHILTDQVVYITRATIEKGKYRGKLTGELKRAVEDWWGDKIG